MLDGIRGIIVGQNTVDWARHTWHYQIAYNMHTVQTIPEYFNNIVIFGYIGWNF